MKKILIPAMAAATLCSASAQSNNSVQEQVNKLKDQIEELQYQVDENIFSFSGKLENLYQYKHFNGKLANAFSKQMEEKDAKYNYFSMMAHLNIMARPSDRMTFFGRLSTTKYYNEGSKSGQYDGLSIAAGRRSSNSSVFFERAFINYKILNDLTLTIGRLPTLDGTPLHLSNGSSEMGAYPILSYASVLDGAALTQKFNVLNGSLKARFIYSPTSYVDYDDTEYGTENPVDSEGIEIKSTSPFLTAMLDFETYKLGNFAKKAKIVLHGLVLDHASLAEEGMDFDKDGNNEVQGNLKFSVKKIITSIELNKIANTGLDFAAQFMYSETKSSGKLEKRGYHPKYKGNTLIPIGGFLTGKESDKITGIAYLISTRYSFSDKFKLGYEFVYSGEGAFNHNFAPRLQTNFYGTKNSKGHHGYLNSRLTDNLTFVLGYMNQKVDKFHILGSIGEGRKADIDIHTGYSNLIATF